MNKMSEKSDKSVLALYVKNFIFGVEDSLVSTLGLLSGVAVAGVSRSEIFLVGIILIFVEAFSMGVGSYLSEGFSDDFLNGKNSKGNKTLLAGFIMWFSYFATGFIPLSPYLLFEVSVAFPISIIISLLSLFILGYVGAKFFNLSPVKKGIKMLLIGGGAILVGVVVAKYVQTP